MYKFSTRHEREDKETRNDSMYGSTDAGAAPSDPAAPESSKEMLQERLASMLNPDLQQRYKERKQQAIAQQKANYQGPEAIEALQQGESMRALQTGLQRAANKFGSVGGDGGQKSDFGDTAAAFDKIDRQDFALKQSAYKQGVEAEDRAVDEEYQSELRPLQLKSKRIDAAEEQAQFDWKEAPVNEYVRTVTEQALAQSGMGGKVPWDKIKNRDLERNPFLKGAVTRATAAQSGKPVYQKLLDKDGVVRLYAIQPDGSKELVGDAGFAGQVRTDPVTGGLITVNPNRGGSRGSSGAPARASGSSVAPASSPSAPSSGVPSTALQPGESVKQRDVRVKLEIEQAQESMKQGIKEKSAVKDVGEKVAGLDTVEKELLSLHKNATLKGPGLGQVAQFGTKMGVNLDDSSQQFEGRLGQWANAYIKEISGAGVPVAEYNERFKPLLPSISDTEATVRNKLKAFKQTVQAEYGVKVQRSGEAKPAPKKAMKASELP